MLPSIVEASKPLEAAQTSSLDSKNTPAEFLSIDGERFICIHQMEQIPTFFLTMVSASDHWLFVASNGALSAGRASPETALFPYYTVDKIIDNWNSTGPQTFIQTDDQRWEPFKPYTQKLFTIGQRIFKSVNGDTIIFEEINHDLNLSFCYSWQSSEKYGFIRTSKLTNLGSDSRHCTVVDGITNFMAAGVDQRTQSHYSCLTDAYKLSELHAGKQLLVHRMSVSLTDEAVPLESLRATTIWSHGWSDSQILLRHEDAETYLKAPNTHFPQKLRAYRGSFLNAGQITLTSGHSKQWSLIAEVEQSQSDTAALAEALNSPETIWADALANIQSGKALLDTLIAASDGQQISSEETVTTHHRANVLFNIMRGGVFPNGYDIETRALKQHILQHLKSPNEEESNWLSALPESLTFEALLGQAATLQSATLKRICREYLPLTFSRRHGDPSRPWNQFTIQTIDQYGNPTIGFQGNWRDIFQNWEALAYSFPHYNEAFVRKFLNASTADGYNPYRITANGIEWEEPDPTDPWASIGYWGDHQIIYLLKLLEFSEHLDSGSLLKQQAEPAFVFADVPYEIKSFADLERDPNHSIHFNEDRNQAIEARAQREGSNGKLVHNHQNGIVHANLLEKLIIPLAVKLSNFVPGGGIWMNTQRPEWNDANNALAGLGLSMVTTCYLHRYLGFMDRLLAKSEESFECFKPLHDFIHNLNAVLTTSPEESNASADNRYTFTRELGIAGERYRECAYEHGLGDKITAPVETLKTLIASTRAHLKHTIDANRRDDGLYHSYNILHIDADHGTVHIEQLGPMLEGQVAILSSDAIEAEESIQFLKALRKSPLYCELRNSYILYANKELPTFLDYNRIELEAAQHISLIAEMLSANDARLIVHSADGFLRFNPALRNRFELEETLTELATDPQLSTKIQADKKSILDLYEATFNHSAFTGRSGSMFAYEGLGSIYWHMVSKLMLATQELALKVSDTATFESLAAHYYDIQNGLGFRKTPAEYGAFPTDAYSHTPAHTGAQQPGLTGMVKEGVICRFAELGVQIHDQGIRFQPRLLRRAEFLQSPTSCEIIRTSGLCQTFELSEQSLLFTFAQTPIIYTITSATKVSIDVALADGKHVAFASESLDTELSEAIFNRSEAIDRIIVHIPDDSLLSELNALPKIQSLI